MNSEKMSTIHGSTLHVFKAYCNCFHTHATAGFTQHMMYIHGGLNFFVGGNFMTGGQIQFSTPIKNYPLYGNLCFAHAHHGYIHTHRGAVAK